MSGRLLGWLETRCPAVPLAQAGKADAIVVLGGIFSTQLKPGFLPNLADSGDRLEGGLALFQAGAAPWLVFTGGRIQWDGRPRVEGDDSRDVARSRGVPVSAIVVTREVNNTAAEARAVADLMCERGWKRILLVTTAWHMPRSLWLFQRAGIACTAFPVDFRCEPYRPVALVDFLPSGGALNDTETVLREIYCNVFYRVFR